MNLAANSKAPPNPYELWRSGAHTELLELGNTEFLKWAANYGRFPHDEWEKRFRILGKLKQRMFRRMGKLPHMWCPMVELRMPAGCTASCTYCNAATVRKGATWNTKESILDAIPVIRFPETIGLCAEWGDPCLHPDVIEAVNKRIEQEWLVTRYTFLTNLSATEAVVTAFPYIRTLLIHCTMAEPAHAEQIMGYKTGKWFHKVYENIKRICELRKASDSVTVTLLFIADPSTLPYIAQHYEVFKDMEGLSACRYKSAWKFEDKLADHPEARKQKQLLAEMTGKVPVEWRVW